MEQSLASASHSHQPLRPAPQQPASVVSPPPLSPPCVPPPPTPFHPLSPPAPTALGGSGAACESQPSVSAPEPCPALTGDAGASLPSPQPSAVLDTGDALTSIALCSYSDTSMAASSAPPAPARSALHRRPRTRGRQASVTRATRRLDPVQPPPSDQPPLPPPPLR